MLMNLIRPLLTGHKGGDTTVANMNTTTASKPPKPESDETDNLLASLIQGKLPKIDWLNAFLGPTAKNGGFGSGAKEEGNALAQIFGGKGGGGAGSLLFGSGLDDDPNVISRRNKS
uniref:Uncharacterized protein n=1 Tax=Ditylenchus dipsaci TaxID=166011 RepID=A0A915E7Y3_9BILA